MRWSRAGLILLGLLVTVAAAAPWLAPHDPDERSGPPFARPSTDHPLGTNDVGQDLLSELLFGTRVSLLVGVLAALVATGVGALVGVSSGYVRGRLDAVLMRMVDVVLALPPIPLAIVIGVFAGPGLLTQLTVIAAVLWAPIARELRAQVLSLRERDHIQAARAMGATAGYVLPRHLAPALAPLLVPQFVLAVKTAIVLEASLAFLGLGDVTTKSWGSMLSVAHGRSAFHTDAWLWWVLPPGVAIAVTVFAFALIGYGLEERARPSLSDRDRRCRGRPGAHGTSAVVAQSPPSGAETVRIGGLRVGYGGAVPAVLDLDLTVAAGEIVGLVGESGSGKSTVASVLCGLLPPAGRVLGGCAWVCGRDVTVLTPDQMRQMRGSQIGLIPQEAMSALNPVHTVSAQICEAVRAGQHEKGARLTRRQARIRAGELLALVGLDLARGGAYPHELSGGMRQRVVIAIALARRPAVLVADEPTSGLDPAMTAEILALLGALRRDLGVALLVISHDLTAVARVADRIAVMRAGALVEVAPTSTLLAAAEHPYSRLLLAASDRPVNTRAPATGPALLSVRGLDVAFGHGPARVRAVHGVDLDVGPGEIVALVGGSGAGKSTVARAVAGLVLPTGGRIVFDGVDLETRRASTARRIRRGMHLVFQDPYAALPPAMRVGSIIAEPMVIAGEPERRERGERVREALVAVQLPADYVNRYPHQLSGGERQRVAIARALVAGARLILADEPTGMLDASLRAEIVDLLATLRDSRGVAILHITHDLNIARTSCDRVVVMCEGAVVETGATASVFAAPAHPYTAHLLAAGAPARLTV